MTIKDQTEFSNFLNLDMRVGRVVKVDISEAKKPTYRMSVDFGPEIGEKVTVAAYTHLKPEELEGKLVIGVMNLGVLKMGPERSEFFCIGVPNEEGEAIPLSTLHDVPLGGQVY